MNKMRESTKYADKPKEVREQGILYVIQHNTMIVTRIYYMHVHQIVRDKSIH